MLYNIDVLQKIKLAPESPGVYCFLRASSPTKSNLPNVVGAEEVRLYIGKAINIKKRLESYTRADNSSKILKMLSLATDITWTECNNEAEALLLEAKQIEIWKPQYNTLLKDDKSFLQLVIDTTHQYPSLRTERVRKSKARKSDEVVSVVKKQKTTFGPFVGSGSFNCGLKALTDVVQKVFLLRNCSDQSFVAHCNQKHPCLQYHIKYCSAPCVNYIAKEDYKQSVSNAISFLNGNTKLVIKNLTNSMNNASEKMEFELAKSYLDRINAVNKMGISTLSGLHQNCDILGFYKGDMYLCLYVTFIRNGINTGSIDMIGKCENDFGFPEAAMQFYEQFTSEISATIIVPKNVSSMDINLLKSSLLIDGHKCSVCYPDSDQEKELMNWCILNAKSAVLRSEGLDIRNELALQQLKDVFNVSLAGSKLTIGKGYPGNGYRIEIFDNSHLFGAHALGAMVVANETGFLKGAYSIFTFGKNNGDDYGMMYKMLSKRLKKIKLAIEVGHSQEIPDLWLIDGGSAHRTIVLKAMESEGLFLPFICISKGINRNCGRERFWTTDKDFEPLQDGMPLLMFLQNLRDEAHRFAITSNRRRRIKEVGVSALDNIRGIGKAKKAVLLLKFKSVEEIASATIKQLTSVPGINKTLAAMITNYFK